MANLNHYLIQDLSKEDIEEALNHANENTVAADVLHVQNDVLDKWYEICRNLLHEKRFEEAADAFTFLTFISPVYSTFWQGLGIAEQSLEHYEEACFAYMMSINCNQNNIESYINCAQCCLALNEIPTAHTLCHKALELIPQGKEHEADRTFIQELLGRKK